VSAEPTERDGEGRGAIYASFTNGDDFVTDLAQDAEKVERRIVRVGKSAKPSEDETSAEVLLEAQAIVAGHLVELRQPCGTLHGAATHDEELQRRLHEDLAWLRGELEHLGLDVRAGSWRRA
jgi:hypothetical protein